MFGIFPQGTSKPYRQRPFQRGAARLFLDVRADNPGAQTLYEALGFEPIAVRPGYYQPDNVDAVVMRHTLVPPAPGLAGEQS